MTFTHNKRMAASIISSPLSKRGYTLHLFSSGRQSNRILIVFGWIVPEGHNAFIINLSIVGTNVVIPLYLSLTIHSDNLHVSDSHVSCPIRGMPQLLPTAKQSGRKPTVSVVPWSDPPRGAHCSFRIIINHFCFHSDSIILRQTVHHCWFQEYSHTVSCAAVQVSVNNNKKYKRMACTVQQDTCSDANKQSGKQ